MNFRVARVHYMPKELEEGILYVSDEFETAAHLCACGCKSKIRTPLLPTEWRLYGSDERPTLRPSVGNWQKPCRSHYWIMNGQIEWAGAWSEERIIWGRLNEQRHREIYFANRRGPWWKRLLSWFKRLGS